MKICDTAHTFSQNKKSQAEVCLVMCCVFSRFEPSGMCFDNIMFTQNLPEFISFTSAVSVLIDTNILGH